MSFVTCKFQPNSGGAEFEVKNIVSYHIGLFREPNINGHLGRKGHDIHLITIVREKSLQDDGIAQIEDDTIKLAAATEKKAYFKANMTLARATDSTDVIQKVSWDTGHIAGIDFDVHGEQITETLQVCVTDLKVDDFTFKRALTR